MSETTSARAKQFMNKMQKVEAAYQRAAKRLAELEQKKLDLVQSYNKKKDDERLVGIRASLNN